MIKNIFTQSVLPISSIKWNAWSVTPNQMERMVCDSKTKNYVCNIHNDCENLHNVSKISRPKQQAFAYSNRVDSFSKKTDVYIKVHP